MVRHRIILTLISLSLGKLVFAQLPALPVGLPDVKCPDLVAQARAATEVDHLPPVTGEGSKRSPLTSLAIVVKTSSDPFSGSADDLWLDVGPRAWKVGNDFPGGSTKIFQFDLHTPDPAIDIPRP